MSSAKKLLVLMAATWLAGCSFLAPTVRVKFDPSCRWFKDQTFSKETKEWLSGDLEWLEWADTWPSYVVQDFNEVRNNNDLYTQEC